MTVRVRLFHLLVLSISWVCADARSLEISDDFVKQTYQELKDKFQPPHLVPRNEQFTAQASLCSLCEQFIAEALYYLGANKTQAEIMDILHGTCSKMEAFYPQVTMGNYLFSYMLKRSIY
uniref:Saposin-like type B region 1 domain-containing protein n=1 Tax=Nelumbo nucifera TaxID=4432 RepID=A0A822YA93_NELNU|nr:TPA_asm: hypothetical protein HUJ06_029657 [Nelumbo nucifera]